MLFSNVLDNVPKFCAFADSLSIEKCYQSIKSLTGDTNALFDNGVIVSTASSHHLHHNHNRIRWKKSQRQRTSMAHQNQRTPTPYTFNAVVLFFIVLLSHDQTTTVYGARSRDSSNSIYQSNNLSVNNVIKIDSNASAAIDTNTVVNHIDVELPIDTFVNVTNDDEFEQLLRHREYSSGSTQKRDPIYQNEFAVYVPGGTNTADRIAYKHGFDNMGQVSEIAQRYQFNQIFLWWP